MSAAYPFASSVKVETTLDVLGTRNIETTQQGLLQQILVATAVNGGGGGSSSPGLPVWTYTAGAMAAGKLKTDNVNPASTSSIELSVNPKIGSTLYGFFGAFNAAPSGLYITLVDAEGRANVFIVATVVNNTSSFSFVGSWLGGTTNWSGDYQVSFSTVVGALVNSINGVSGGVTLLPPDTGWTANADAGSKTSVIPSGTDLDTIAAALDLLVTNAGTTLKTVAEKCKALEYALANNLRPNA